MCFLDEDEGTVDEEEGEGSVNGKVSARSSNCLEGAAKELVLLHDAFVVQEPETATYGILPTEGAFLPGKLDTFWE